MTRPHSDWKGLPFEILQKVFRQVPQKHLSNLSLVCKAWTLPAQTVLYSAIYIRTFSQLRKFYTAVKSNKLLGFHVKKLELCDFLGISNKNLEPNASTKTLNFLTLLLTILPNLEVFEDNNQLSYILVFNTLLGSNLKHLKKLKSPKPGSSKDEVGIFLNCISLINDCLEDISISDLTIDQLLHYVSKRKHLFVSDIEANKVDITEAFRTFWSATSAPGTQEMVFTYKELIQKEMLEINNFGNPDRLYPRIIYPTSSPGWIHTDFIEKNGKFMDYLILMFIERDFEVSQRFVLPRDFMTHTLTNCPYLKKLRLEQCTLKRSITQTRMDASEKKSLLELTFQKCFIKSGVLEELSHLVLEVEELGIEEVKPTADEESEHGYGSPILEINMPHTEIRSIFLNYFLSRGKRFYVKVFASIEERYYYFRFNHSLYNDGCMEVSEEHFMMFGEHDYIYVCCKNKPKIKFDVTMCF